MSKVPYAADRIAQFIRERRSGFNSGDRISALRLRAALGISRPTAEKAIDELVARGLVERTSGGRITSLAHLLAEERNGGYPRITNRAPKDEELFENWKWQFQEAAAQAAIGGAESPDMRLFVKAAIAISDHRNRDDVNRFEALNRYFLMLLVCLGQNSAIRRTLHRDRFYGFTPLSVSPLVVWQRPSFREEIALRAQSVFNYVVRGDPEGARNAARAYMEYFAAEYATVKADSHCN